ncbi:MAG TPA: hypothetical protein DIT55_02150 [Spirochaetaceae bacterium]|nr:hypothetical protein [Spirochaetaceae bacterium]
MSSKTILGFVLLVAGSIAFFYGLNASKSLVEQVSNTFVGRFSDATTWYMIGGIAAAAAGLLLVLTGVRGRRG